MSTGEKNIDMPKVYYISSVPMKSNAGGVSYKIYQQVKVLRDAGYNVEYKYVGNITLDQIRQYSGLRRYFYLLKTTFDKLVNHIHPYKNSVVNLSILDDIEQGSYVYIRYFLSDRTFIDKLKYLKEKKHVKKIMIEIPTFPYDGEFGRSVVLKRDKRYRDELKKYVDCIATFSDDKKILGIKTLNLSNGVDTNNILPRKPRNSSPSINLLGVAYLGFWHGYDRMIEGLGKYYEASSNPRNVNFYIVGYGDKQVIQQYQEMIDKYNLQNHVFLVGKKEKEELDYYYNICDIGIDSMGRHRSNVYYNSSLKGKEYLAKGLPIVSGVTTELDYITDFPFYYRVPADDTPVDINGVLKFYDDIYKDKSKKEVVSVIRKFCEDNFDFEKCFGKVVDWYKE